MPDYIISGLRFTRCQHGLYFRRASSLFIVNSMFDRNWSSGYGALVWRTEISDYVNAVIQSCVFAFTSGNFGSHLSFSSVLVSANATVTVVDSQFIGRRPAAVNCGDGIRISLSNAVKFIVDNCTFSSAIRLWYGAEIHTQAAASYLRKSFITIRNTRFSVVQSQALIIDGSEPITITIAKVVTVQSSLSGTMLPCFFFTLPRGSLMLSNSHFSGCCLRFDLGLSTSTQSDRVRASVSQSTFRLGRPGMSVAVSLCVTSRFFVVDLQKRTR